MATRVGEPDPPENAPQLRRVLADPANLITGLGLVVGAVAVGLAINEHFAAAIALALVAVVVDQLDGLVARSDPTRSGALRVVGAHLDCYSDFLSKGVFPATLLMVTVDFSLAFAPVAVLHVLVIATRYSYEFVPGAPGRGLSPDYTIVGLALCHLFEPRLGVVYTGTLVAVMLLMGGLNLAPIRPTRLEGERIWVFIAALLGLAATLVSVR